MPTLSNLFLSTIVFVIKDLTSSNEEADITCTFAEYKNLFTRRE